MPTNVCSAIDTTDVIATKENSNEEIGIFGKEAAIIQSRSVTKQNQLLIQIHRQSMKHDECSHLHV